MPIARIKGIVTGAIEALFMKLLLLRSLRVPAAAGLGGAAVSPRHRPRPFGGVAPYGRLHSARPKGRAPATRL